MKLDYSLISDVVNQIFGPLEVADLAYDAADPMLKVRVGE